ncbi:MAG: protoheme IX farnesyltransferase [Chloroflexi bacterium]|nr:protoheme IX farnesyltransferase [Chloroflexota bacterium]
MPLDPLRSTGHDTCVQRQKGFFIRQGESICVNDIRTDPEPATFHSPIPPASTTPGIGNTLRNYLWLTKPLVTILLLCTTLGAMLIAQRGIPAWSLMFFALLGGALTASGASAINAYADRDIDPLMGRTARRPIPSGAIAATHALVFGLVLSAAGVLVLGLFVNWLSAALSSIGLFYYVVIYTLWLKRTTPQNIVIGGAAGAIPPLVGWAAVTNEISVLAMFLFLIVFHWTPPHTWALMLMVTKDYERAGVPMMPVAQGEDSTRRQIVFYTLGLVITTLVPFALQLLGLGYLLAALVLGGWLLYLAVKLQRDRSKATARRLYRYSNYYLALLFLAAVLASMMRW